MTVTADTAANQYALSIEGNVGFQLELGNDPNDVTVYAEGAPGASLGAMYGGGLASLQTSGVFGVSWFDPETDNIVSGTLEAQIEDGTGSIYFNPADENDNWIRSIRIKVQERRNEGCETALSA